MKQKILNEYLKNLKSDFIFCLTIGFYVPLFFLISTELNSFRQLVIMAIILIVFIYYVILFLIYKKSLGKNIFLKLAKKTKKYQQISKLKIKEFVYYKNGYVFSEKFKKYKIIAFKQKTFLLKDTSSGEFIEVSIDSFLSSYSQ